jgi:thiol-disulfide isomerase/thioredoxin
MQSLLFVSLAALAVSCNTPRADSTHQGNTSAENRTATGSASGTAASGATVPAVEHVDAAEGADMAPNFTWHGADGAEHSLKELRGKVVMVNFWATWCPPCRRELPDVVKIRQDLSSKGFEVLGVAVFERPPEGTDVGEYLAQFTAQNGLTYPMVSGNEELVNAYGDISAIPTTFIIDRKGKIIQKFIGGQSYDAFRQAIEPAL